MSNLYDECRRIHDSIQRNPIQFNHHVYIFPTGLHTDTATQGNERFEKFALDDFLVGVTLAMDNNQMIFFRYASLNDNKNDEHETELLYAITKMLGYNI